METVFINDFHLEYMITSSERFDFQVNCATKY